MITEPKLLAMLQLQSALNAKIHPEWFKQKFPWTDAIMVEGTEALEHYGWKWWKKQEPDLPQVRIELVDIWHFALSIYLERNGNSVNATCAHLKDQLEFWDVPSTKHTAGSREWFRALVASAAQGNFNIPAFLELMRVAELSWDELYTIYVGKNVLNTFRQDNGYKAGTYVKMWHGQEDNVALEQLMKLRPDATPEELYTKLISVYASVVAQPH